MTARTEIRLSFVMHSCLLTVLVMLGSGCVSTDTHNKTLTDLDLARKAAAKTSSELDELKKKSAADQQNAQLELDKTRQQLASLRQGLEEEQRARQSAESTLAQLKDKLQQAEKRSEDLQQRLSGIEQEKAALNSQLGEGQAQIRDLQSKLAAESSQASALGDEKQRLLSGLSGAQAEVARLQKQAGELEAEASRLAQEREQLRKDQDQLRSVLDQERDRLKAEEAEKARLQKDQEQLRTSLDQERNRLKAEEAEKARLEQERAAKEEEIKRLTRTQEELSKSLQDEISKGNITIQQVRDRLTINMVDRVLFDSGHANVKPEGLKVLKQVSDILKKVEDKQIRIEGHTDNVPIGAKIRDRFPTNWELSTARATSVVRYLIEQGGVDRQFLSAVGYADTRPQASNDTEEGRTSNRRIEIVLYPKDLSQIAGQLKTDTP